MPLFTIETAYRLPAYRQRKYEADAPEQACRLAVEDHDRDGDAVAYESTGETYVTGIWREPDPPDGPSAVPVPSQDRAIRDPSGLAEDAGRGRPHAPRDIAGLDCARLLGDRARRGNHCRRTRSRPCC
jgi:hypothetical protein